MILTDIAREIELRENGIYFSKKNNTISYPEKGNQDCYQYEDDSFWFQHRNNVIAESIKNLSKKEVFFDIGGGNGFVAKRLQDEGIETVLVEPGVSGAKSARERGVQKVICSTLNDAGFKKESISSVGFFDVMEHIENDKEFVSEIASFLKPNGLLYLTVPAYNGLWSKDDEYAGHYKRYKLKELEHMFNDLGFEIQYKSYLFSLLFLPILFFKTIPSKFGLAADPSDVNQQKKNHVTKKGIMSSILASIWNWELNQVKKRKKIPIGSSCFLIAKKIN